MNLETKITIYNFTPSGFYVDPYYPVEPPKGAETKKNRDCDSFFLSCGGLTRTDDLWVMSPTSYQLLHSAIL